MILEAVKQHGTALRYASCELRNDKEIVFVAVTKDVFRNAEKSMKFQSCIVYF